MINLINCETQPTENHRVKLRIAENFSPWPSIISVALCGLKNIPQYKDN